MIGGLFIFGAEHSGNAGKFDSLITPYMLVGSTVIVVAIVFAFTRLPEINEKSETEKAEDPPMRNLLKHPAFIIAVVAQFLYVAAQTGINSFFINYVTEEMLDVQVSIQKIMMHLGSFGKVFMPKNPEQAASLILAFGGMGLFWTGRLFGSYLMKFINPQRLLAVYAIVNTCLTFIVVMAWGWASVIALFSTYFFMSVMFPTIFALGIKDLGPLTKKGSSFLVMAVAGGAFCPPLMGLMADTMSMSLAFLIPMGCFVFVAWYAIWGNKKQQSKFENVKMLSV